MQGDLEGETHKLNDALSGRTALGCGRVESSLTVVADVSPACHCSNLAVYQSLTQRWQADGLDVFYTDTHAKKIIRQNCFAIHKKNSGHNNTRAVKNSKQRYKLLYVAAISYAVLIRINQVVD